MLLLELFAGTGSVGRVAKRKGYKVISLDFDPKTKVDIHIDILHWDYKSVDFIPDFIWASPPCNTYSIVNYFRMPNDRDKDTAEPYSERAKTGTKILYKTLEIIKYFSTKNKNMKFCIENPVGMMRKDKKMLKLYRETTSYNQYGDKRYKPTDFWANFKMNLKPVKRPDNTVTIKELSLNERYKIPSKLISHILDMAHTNPIIKGGYSTQEPFFDYYYTL